MPPTTNTNIRANKYQYLQESVHYHVQCSRKIIQNLKTESIDPVLKDKLCQIWQIESAWFACIRCVPDLHRHDGQFLSEEILNNWTQLSNQFSAYVWSLNETRMNEVVHVYIPGILDFYMPRFNLIQICIDHSKIHHEQLSKLLVNPESDFKF